MTLDEAIRHLQDILGDPEHQWSCDACRQEHEELLEFLQELKTARIRLLYIEDQNPELATRSEMVAEFAQTAEWINLAERIGKTMAEVSAKIAETIRTMGAVFAAHDIKQEEEDHGND